MPKIKAKRLRVKDKNGVWKDVPAVTGPGGGGTGGGMNYDIGFGLNLSKDLVLSAEVGASSFTEIPNTKVQEIFNKVMTED